MLEKVYSNNQYHMNPESSKHFIPSNKQLKFVDEEVESPLPVLLLVKTVPTYNFKYSKMLQMA